MIGNWNWTRRLTWIISCVAHSAYWSVGKYRSIRAFLKAITKSVTPGFRTENMVSFKEVWPWNQFERFVVLSTIRLKGKVNFFIREFFEVFYFPSVFIFVIGCFKFFFEKFQFKLSASSHWKLSPYKFIYYFIVGSAKT